MANYVLYKPAGDYIKINAYLEDRHGGLNITTGKILNSMYADYKDVTLLIPEEFKPEIYENIYGEMLLKLELPDRNLRHVGEYNGNRLPVEEAGGKEYAYIDIYRVNVDNNLGEERRDGKMIRARFEIKET